MAKKSAKPSPRDKTTQWLSDRHKSMVAWLYEIKRFSEAHHGDQPAHILLHGLTIDIPAMIDSALRNQPCPKATNQE